MLGVPITAEATEAQRGKIACSRSHSSEETKETRVLICASARLCPSSPCCRLPLNQRQTSDSKQITEVRGGGRRWNQVTEGAGWWDLEKGSAALGWRCQGQSVSPPSRAHTFGIHCPSSLLPGGQRFLLCFWGSWAPVFPEEALSVRRFGPTHSELATKGGLSS